MKKILIIGLFAFLPIINVNALTLKENGIYITQRGYTLTSEEYEKLRKNLNDSTIDVLSENGIEVFLNDSALHSEHEEYSITTDILQNGKVVESYTMKATKEEVELVAKNKNYHVMSDNKLHYINDLLVPYDKNPSNSIAPYSNIEEDDNTYEHATSSKVVRIAYGNYGGTHTAYMEVEWSGIPMIKKYDILAFRWDTAISTSNIIDFYGSQRTFNANGEALTTYYDKNSENYKATSKGLGQIMNIYDAAASDLSMVIAFDSSVSCGNWMYGSYQHARNSNITLSAAKSYTFSSSGLGGVVYFSNSTTRGYYDGMGGVKDHKGDGPEYDWG